MDSNSVNGVRNLHEKRRLQKNEGNRGSENRTRSLLREFNCFRPDYGISTTETSYGRRRGMDFVADAVGEETSRTHLIVTVNGLLGCAQDWRYAEKQLLKKYPHDVIVHCSKCNTSRLTFDGVDVMGERLADEVRSVVRDFPFAKKISFIGHSLGGLVARYAVAKLYERDPSMESSENGVINPSVSGTGHKPGGKIAGLEPMNFITFATPHLGSGGHKQIPMFCGSYPVEKLVSSASWFLGRTGRHLFLTDNDSRNPPLLLRMASDCENLQFISALGCFHHRIVYANTQFDHLVGWSTSSLRRQHELPSHQMIKKNAGYPHIVSVGERKPKSSIKDHMKYNSHRHKRVALEEEMLKGLGVMNWDRVDVNFKGSNQRFIAHNTIQVSKKWLSDGRDVIIHMVDNFIL